jgi:hypothetical protein
MTPLKFDPVTFEIILFLCGHTFFPTIFRVGVPFFLKKIWSLLPSEYIKNEYRKLQKS